MNNIDKKMAEVQGTDTFKKQQQAKSISYAQNKNIRLGYGSNEIDWERKKYEINRRNMLFKKRIMNGCD